jgi:hypothetical protein
VLFHQDKAPAQKSFTSTAIIDNAAFKILEQPSFSPDLISGNYCLLPTLKSTFGVLVSRRSSNSDRGKRVALEIQKKAIQELQNSSSVC